jgi:transketolase
MNYEELISSLLQSNKKLMILTAENRAAIRNISKKLEHRFLDVGIAEQTMIGMAAGLALRGNIPVVHALAAFLTMRAYEFIRTDVGISGLPVKIVGSVAGLLSEANGPTHQSVEDIALMRTIPNIQIFCPADEQDMLIGLPQILSSQYPAYIRFNNVKEIYSHSDVFEPGNSEIISDGSDMTILTYGYMFGETFKACDILKRKGISSQLVNMRMLNPFDENTILEAAKSSGRIVTIEDHFINGGLYSIVCESLVRNNITANVFPVALTNKWFKPALINDVLKYEGLDAETLAIKIEKFLNQEYIAINKLPVKDYAE